MCRNRTKRDPFFCPFMKTGFSQHFVTLLSEFTTRIQKSGCDFFHDN